MSFRERVRTLIRDRKSVLCISIDPALPFSRDRFVIPERYIEDRDDEDALLDFILDIIDTTYDRVIAYKLNLWYLIKLSNRNHKYIAGYIRRLGNIPILDCKINDITDTVRIGIENIAETGYEAITVNPLLGNLDDIARECRRRNLGTLVLTLTSNKEASKYFKECKFNNEPLYLKICKDISDADADGSVIGLTGSITVEDIRNVRNIIGRDRILFLVGVGAQGGDLSKIDHALPGLIIVNVGRDIIYSEDPLKRVEYYNNILSRFLEKVSVT